MKVSEKAILFNFENIGTEQHCIDTLMSVQGQDGPGMLLFLELNKTFVGYLSPEKSFS